MNIPWHRPLQHGARALGWVAGVGVIALAVLVALAQALLPLVAQHPQWVARELSTRLARPVSFAALDGRWTPAGPVFALSGLTIGVPPGGSGQPVRVPKAELRLDFGGWLLPTRYLLNLRASGLQLNLARDRDGRWHVNGLGTGEGSQPADFGQLSMALWLDHLQLDITDARHDRHYRLTADQVRLSRQGDELRVGLLMQRDGATGVLRGAGRFQEDGSSGRLWLAGQRVDWPALLAGVDLGGYAVRSGRGDLALWLDWKAGQVVRSFARIDLAAVQLTTPAGASVRVPAIHGEADLRRNADGYVLRWAGADDGALAAWVHAPGTPQLRIEAAARELQLAPLVPWLGALPKLPPTLVAWVGSGHPRGRLDTVNLAWSKGAGLTRLSADFSGLGIDHSAAIPGVSGLRGSLRGDGEALSLSLPAQPATVDARPMFRTPFALANLAGTVAAWQADGDWHIGLAPLDFAGTGYGGQLRGEMRLHAAGGPPFLDLYARVNHADVQAAKLFWPVSVMSPGTVAWLDHALLGGRIDGADVAVRGDLKDWPFHHHEGRFEARAEISDLKLHYAPDWPDATGVHAIANFINSGMLVEADGGQALGVKVDQAVALFPDFADATLDLNVDGHGNAANLLDFVRKSPIANQQAKTLAKLKLGGTGSFGFHLSLPLGMPETAVLTGQAKLDHVDVSEPDWTLKLDQLSGPATFDRTGFHAGPLEGRFHGQPAVLDLAIAGATGDADVPVAVDLRGAFRFSDLTLGYPALDWLNPLGSGRSLYDIGFRLTRPTDGGAPTQTLSLDSTLVGTTLDAPAPLAKAATAELPLHVSLSLPIDGADLKVSLGQVARGFLRLAAPGKPLAGTLAFGAQMPTTLPAQGLRVRGHAATLDVTGWVQQAVAFTAGGTGGGGPALESVDVGTAQAQWFGRPLGPMTLQLTPRNDSLVATVEGAAMAGQFSVPEHELAKRGITARLKRLYWPGNPTADKAAVSQPEPDPADTGVNPAALPPFHLWVGDLTFGDARLGEARLETWPTERGMHIDQLRALSPSVQLTGSGDWNGTATNSHTRMRIGFAADDLGKMLGAFGYNGLVTGGKTSDQLDASWPGAPSSFSLANATGTLSVHVSDGHIPDVGPGMGRLFGLVSLAELPRRLTLDFGDVFGKGLGFDSIDGDFHLADGSATTSNLLIKGPAAQIGITGRTGLRARDYDQQVVVVPHFGNSLPVLGAVVGGPVGAAAGFAVQGLLGKGLNKTISARYHVTGSWDKPVMTLVEKHNLPAARSSQRPPLLPTAPSPPVVTTPLRSDAPAASSSVP
ncbi:MAG: TIGR02099 family protein [Rhodanobacter sp.]|nr:MAG: TIGR02099 family protein [Rhodanobacter sp.]TAM13209.1 MAG: TIGR02099 family protein [Rhodanobacter sp.]TAM35371.1 MAG: TIGR02099 family protein [Rhodanobacter sp.]